MTKMPVAFVAHGAPDALLKAPDTVACWRDIGSAAGRPSAILVVSAHWEARVPIASLSGAPKTIHDFSGFAPELFRLGYAAPGAPELAERAVSLLGKAGIAADLHPSRGLDHGAWVPLLPMFPDADIPVTQLAVVRGAGPAAHWAIGRALAPLRADGVLILASGAITHNFDWLDWRAGAATPPLPQAQAVADWLGAKIAVGDLTALLDYRSNPDVAAAHPTDEHLMPLFVALGAAGDDAPTRHRPRFAYGGLAMDAYVWG